VLQRPQREERGGDILWRLPAHLVVDAEAKFTITRPSIDERFFSIFSVFSVFYISVE